MNRAAQIAQWRDDARIFGMRAARWEAMALRIAKSGKREGGYGAAECQAHAHRERQNEAHSLALAKRAEDTSPRPSPQSGEGEGNGGPR